MKNFDIGTDCQTIASHQLRVDLPDAFFFPIVQKRSASGTAGESVYPCMIFRPIMI
jgi:hypothetical protein